MTLRNTLDIFRTTFAHICNVEQRLSLFIFAGAVKMTLRIALDIFRKTFALFIDAVSLTVAVCKPLLTSRHCH
jgi:hypothetical protein